MTLQEENIQHFQQAYQQKLEEWKKDKPTVLLAGRTGVGKSSLVNAVFDHEAAQVGTGRPVTKHYTRYEGELMTIYDTQGWELGEDKEKVFYEDTQKLLEQATGEDGIDIVWYMLDAPSSRFTDFDADLALNAFGGLGVLFILTKCDIAHSEQISALRQAIDDVDIPNCLGVVEVAASPQSMRGRAAPEAFGLQEVVTQTLKALPDAKKIVFSVAQNVDLKQKDAASKNLIRNHVTAAFMAGFMPIPFGDAALLVPIQIMLIAHLARVYNIDIRNAPVWVSFIIEQVVATLGRGTAGRLLKMFPGAGIIMGGTITGSVAASFTAAIGFAFRTVFHEMYKLKQQGKESLISDQWTAQLLEATLRTVWEELKNNPNIINRFDNLK